MVRVGIAGTGFIGGIHARSARLARGQLVGVAASSPERSRLAADALGADHAYESAEALATAEDIDVVHICTPNHLHAPLAELALAAGKHVICEKPLAMDSAQARRLTEAARVPPGRRRSRSSTGTTRRCARRASASGGGRRARSA